MRRIVNRLYTFHIRGALEANPNVEPDREHLRHRAPPDRQSQGLPQPKNWPRQGIQADNVTFSAQAKWRKLDGANRLPEIVQGVDFKDGIKQLQAAA
jgi:hypothetical protein